MGLYYLQSRYYDPELGRFLNADVVFDHDAGLQGCDLFAYCGNNPANRIDRSGADSVSFEDDDEEIDEEVPKGGMTSGGANHQGPAIASSPGVRVGSNNYSGNGGRTEVHHVVEQCQATKSGFSKTQIQSDSNKVVLDYNLHRAVSAYYSSKQDFTGGERVRNWLAGQSFEAQSEFGWKVVNYYYTLLSK